jgi:prevent-host-death family protein
MQTLPASKARADLYNLMDQTAQTHEPVVITGKRTNVVMVSQEDWNAIAETLHLSAVPGLAGSIQEAMQSPDSEFSDTVEW